MKHVRDYILIIICCVILCNCHKTQGKLTEQKKLRVSYQTLHQQLHFTGIVQPLHEIALISPSNATVAKLPYAYGQWVTKGASVFTLNSPELQKEFNQNLTEYLKAKDNFTVTQTKFNGTRDLWDAGLISKNNYLSEQSSLSMARITLLQTTKALTDILHKEGQDTTDDLTNLSFANFDHVRHALSSQHNLIILHAPVEGILLYPPKTNDTSTITVGSSVKAGQVLAIIGDLRGIRINIVIPEIDITTLHVGMPVTVRGLAFEHQPLNGRLVEISAQAQTNNSSDLPTFNAAVEVHGLNDVQKMFIKVGMSTNLDLEINTEKKIMIPIAAVQQKNDLNFVKIYTPQGKIKLQPITTGSVSGYQVVVDAGLKVGDEIVYD